MQVVGLAGIEYFTKTGQVPHSIDDLLNGSVLRFYADGTMVGLANSERYPAAIFVHARQVRLVFPEPQSQLKDGPVVLVTCPGVPAGLQARVNAELEKEWRDALEQVHVRENR